MSLGVDRHRGSTGAGVDKHRGRGARSTGIGIDGHRGRRASGSTGGEDGRDGRGRVGATGEEEEGWSTGGRAKGEEGVDEEGGEWVFGPESCPHPPPSPLLHPARSPLLPPPSPRAREKPTGVCNHFKLGAWIGYNFAHRNILGNLEVRRDLRHFKTCQ